MFNFGRKNSLAGCEEAKDVFIADMAAETLFRNISKDLVLNWDQTGLSILPTGNWTMVKSQFLFPKHGMKLRKNPQFAINEFRKAGILDAINNDCNSNKTYVD